MNPTQWMVLATLFTIALLLWIPWERLNQQREVDSRYVIVKLGTLDGNLKFLTYALRYNQEPRATWTYNLGEAWKYAAKDSATPDATMYGGMVVQMKDLP